MLKKVSFKDIIEDKEIKRICECGKFTSNICKKCKDYTCELCIQDELCEFCERIIIYEIKNKLNIFEI
jgi:hypothetical protein